MYKAKPQGLLARLLHVAPKSTFQYDDRGLRHVFDMGARQQVASGILKTPDITQKLIDYNKYRVNGGFFGSANKGKRLKLFGSGLWRQLKRFI